MGWEERLFWFIVVADLVMLSFSEPGSVLISLTVEEMESLDSSPLAVSSVTERLFCANFYPALCNLEFSFTPIVLFVFLDIGLIFI